MGTGGWNNTGRTAGAGLDLLVIADTAQFNQKRTVIIEESDGTTIITVGSEETAIELLRTVAVDAIYNYGITVQREDAERLRAHILQCYPKVRLMDLWSPASRNVGGKSSHVPHLSIQEGLDCETRQRIWLNRVSEEGARLMDPLVASESAEKTKSRFPTNDDRVA